MEKGGYAGRTHRNNPALDDPEISIDYGKRQTISFFAKETPFVASVFDFAAKTRKTRKHFYNGWTQRGKAATHRPRPRSR
jgi:hypothetical protein